MNTVVHLKAPELELRGVLPGDLHQWWDDCVPFLEECINHDSDEVRMEDLYACIKSGTAFLFVGLVNEHMVGCTILQRFQCQHTGKWIMHIWMVSGAGFMDQGLEKIEHLARGAGVSKIRFRATREAYGRLTRKFGFARTQIEYEKRI